MTLTTSGASADSYVTVTFAESYAIKHFRGTDKTTWDAAEFSDKEASLREATQWIDSMFGNRFVGEIQSSSQALAWPRIGAEDRDGRYINDTPDAVKNATVALALSALGGMLVPDESRGGRVKREKIGPLETEYMDDAPSGTTYRWAEMLLRPVLIDRRGSKQLVRA